MKHAKHSKLVLATMLALLVLANIGCDDFSEKKKEEPVTVKAEYFDKLVISNEKDISELISNKSLTNTTDEIEITVEHLILTKDSTLYIGGRNVVFKVKRLTAEEGTIQSYSEELSSAGVSNGEDGPVYIGTGANGISGGNIKIYAEEADGILNFNLFGQDGGDGVWNGGWGDNPTGEMGAPGDPGYEHQVGLGQIFCSKEPSNGKQGGVGKKGFTGRPGGHGGDSGSLQIEVSGQSSLQIQGSIIFGKGGKGSEGSAGGKGGIGGVPGPVLASAATFKPLPGDVPGHCKGADLGPEGSVGESGDRGEDGRSGAQQSACLKVGEDQGAKCFTAK